MRSFIILCSVFFLLLTGGRCGSRQKRFLRTDFLNPFSDSLVGLGDYARDLSDQLSSQASMAVQHVMPQATRALTRLTPWGHRNRELPDPRPKKNGMRVPVGRETEDEEVELFNPEEKPQTPSFGVGNSFIPFSFSFGFLTPWWEGENVCEERNEVDEPEQETQNFTGFSINFESTRCIPSDSSYVCTKKVQTNGMRRTIVVRRQCCHGFVRRTDGRPGCSALKMENLYDTMKSLEMTKFLNWMESSAGLKERLLTENLTLFTPSNEAIIDFEDDTEDNEISAINPAKMTDIAPTVSGHIVEGFVNIDSLEDEQLLDTIHEQVKIRINKYQPAHEVVTANCIPVSSKNNLATNGIVHLTSGVLPLPRSPLADVLSENKEYSRFKKLLEDSNLLDDLRKDGRPWTLFVPTNAAFRKLPRILQKQIDSGEGCVESILHQHIVKGRTVCTAGIISQNRVRNILENSLQLTKDEAEQLRVDGALMEYKDIVATNGVIHEIDSVLIPPQARNLVNALEDEERQDILDLIETADFLSELEQSKNVTLFLPTKEAIQSLSNDTKEELLNNPQYLRSVLQHHLVQEHLPSSKFLDNSKLTTVGGHNLHLKLHELFPGIVTGATVQCAFLMSHDNQACGAVIHKINKVLIPPKGSITDVLQQGLEGGSHSIVLKLLKNTNLDSKLREEGPFTFLAPTDDAFERMTESSLDDLLENNTLAEDLLKLHLLPEVLCCNGVPHSSPFHRQFVRTFDGSILPLHRGIGDRVRFGRARPLHCDISATNGLVHSINRVIQRQRPRSFTMDLWPFF